MLPSLCLLFTFPDFRLFIGAYPDPVVPPPPPSLSMETWSNRVITVCDKALVRAYLGRLQYSRSLARIVRIQALIRGYIKRTAFVRQGQAAPRIQLCIRTWLRNRELFGNVTGVFDAARRGDVREVTRLVTYLPQLLYVRDRYGASSIMTSKGRREERNGNYDDEPTSPSYSTLLHAACEVRTSKTYSKIIQVLRAGISPALRPCQFVEM